MGDAVNHPGHYNQYKGFEVIEICQQLVGPDGKSGFNLGNAFKYMARAGFKDETTRIEDLKKAVFYINYEIERLELEEALALKKIAQEQEETDLISERRCPACSMYLEVNPNKENVESCLGGHGEMVYSYPLRAWQWRPWTNEPAKPTVFIVPNCLLCQMEMIPVWGRTEDCVYKCPKGHGEVIITETKESHEQCRDCGSHLQRYNGDENVMHCLNGHGRYVRINNTTEWYWMSTPMEKVSPNLKAVTLHNVGDENATG